jgi:VWFA-related protein
MACFSGRATAALASFVGLCALATGAVGVSAGWLPPPTNRTIYVSVVDKDGQPVPGLTPADLSVKEGGKDREITSVSVPAARMHLALMVEESLTADSSVRTGVFEFVKRMLPQADVSLITVGLRNTTITPFTSDINSIVAGINGFPLRQNPVGENMAEGIAEQSKAFQTSRPERPVMVVVGLEVMQASAERPERVLTELRLSRAVLYAVTLSGGFETANVGDLGDLAERARVIGEGTAQSGGRRIEASRTPAVPRALQRVADELLAQYQITYVLPDGVALSDRLSVSLRKKGPTLRAPTRITDRQ